MASKNNWGEEAGAEVSDEENLTEWKASEEPLSPMDQAWKSDANRIVNRDSAEFRMLRNYNDMMKTWIRQNGGVRNPKIWDKMENLTPDGGVKRRSLYPGNPSVPIKQGLQFFMMYTGYVEPNFQNPVDAAPYRGKREIFKFDEESPILPGLHIAIRRMCLGERAHVRLTPDYAYGHQGVPPRIPKNAVLHYIIEVRDEEISTIQASHKFLRQPEDVLGELGFDLCFTAAQQFRQKGVAMFIKRMDEQAIEHFQDGIRACKTCFELMNKTSADEGTTVTDLHGFGNFEELYLAVQQQFAGLKRNSMVCWARLKDWEKVKKLGEELRSRDDRDVKSLYYLALALKETGKLDESFELAKKGIHMHPNSPELSELFSSLAEEDKKFLQKEKLFCMRMFPGLTPKEDPQNQWSVVDEVRQHVAEEIGRVKKGLQEAPMKYTFFSDKVNLAYLKAEASKAGLIVDIKQGKMRPIIRICRPAGG